MRADVLGRPTTGRGPAGMHSSDGRRLRRGAARAAAPTFGMVAAALLVWQGSSAAFTATTANSPGVWTADTLTLQNNGGGPGYAVTTSATFDETGLTPGGSGTKCVTVRNTSGTAGNLKLYRSALADSTPSLGAQV